MKKNIGSLIDEFKNKINIDIKAEDITAQSAGMSAALIFIISNKYLYKMYFNKEIYEHTKYFFDNFNDNEYFQHLVFDSPDNNALCLEYIEGDLLYELKSNDDNLLPQIYEMVSKYKTVSEGDYSKYNFGSNTFADYIEQSINYNKVDNIDYSLMNSSLEVIKKYNYPSYILHGDMGSHNLIIKDGKLKVIDPDIKVGDKLYDFYCCILSDPIIFEKLNKEEILNYFDEYDLEYKKAMFNLCLYYRISVALKYNYYSNTKAFYDMLEKID